MIKCGILLEIISFLLPFSGLVRATEFAIVRARALRLRAAVRALALERRRLREQRPTATTTIYVDKLDFRVSDCKCSM